MVGIAVNETTEPEQIDVAEVEIDTDGTKVGFTVILKLDVVPVQPFAEGVTVTVAVAAVVPPLVAVNPGIGLPEPLAAKPIELLLFAQLNVVPVTGPDKFVAATDPPLQTVTLLIALTVGVGLTVTV